MLSLDTAVTQRWLFAPGKDLELLYSSHGACHAALSSMALRKSQLLGCNLQPGTPWEAFKLRISQPDAEGKLHISLLLLLGSKVPARFYQKLSRAGKSTRNDLMTDLGLCFV